MAPIDNVDWNRVGRRPEQMCRQWAVSGGFNFLSLVSCNELSLPTVVCLSVCLFNQLIVVRVCVSKQVINLALLQTEGFSVINLMRVRDGQHDKGDDGRSVRDMKLKLNFDF